nr:hypothetical protein [Tanacetum cinerariifolium]
MEKGIYTPLESIWPVGPWLTVSVAAITPTISMDNNTLAKALAALKSAKHMAMMDADHELAERLQAEEQGEFSIREMSKLFVKLDEKVEAEADNDQEEAEMKMYIKIVSDDEVSIDVIPLASKPPIIVDWKIIKERKIGSYHIIRQDGSSKRFSSMIQMLQNINREDLETLWKLVKAKYGNKRLEEAYERVFWGDLKVMFEPDIESEVWRKLHGNKVRIWKLFSSCGVHFVRLIIRMKCVINFSSSCENNKRRKEVFGYILLVKIKLLIKKLEDSEGEHQV